MSIFKSDPKLFPQKGGIPLFDKEGLGEISSRICLLNYGLFNNSDPRIFPFRKKEPESASFTRRWKES